MGRKFTLLSLCAMASIGAIAAPITAEQALARISGNGPAKARSASTMVLAHTVKSATGNAAAYVFTPSDGAGFTIASANDVAVPVLGYSETSKFDADNMPIQLKWWLSEMARRAEFLESRGLKASEIAYAPEGWESIEPLCKTIWNQESPYNRETPVINGVQSPTGCVATSFAQAMYYFKYPERGQGTVSYANNGKTLRLNLGAKKIKWDNMLLNYVSGNYTDDEADAVAYLMKACGYSVQMDYGQNSSGAMSYRLVNALINNFNYDSKVSYEDRTYYSTSGWAELIYNNIKNVGPVIYDGTSLEGGHSFICDGYSGDGYFHFNWGWGGLSDGYYVLDVLNPEAQGAGGAVGGFNWGQNAIVNMQKPTGEEPTPQYARMSQLGNTFASVNSTGFIEWKVNDSNQLGWGCGNYVEGRVAVGGKIEKLSDHSYVGMAEGGMGNIGGLASLQPGYWYPQTTMYPVMQLPQGLADGEYKITLVCRDDEYEDSPWQDVLITYGFANYTILTVENGNYSVANQPVQTLTFEDMGFVNNLYYGKNTMLKGNVVNNTDLDMTMCIQPILVANGKQQFEGDVILVSCAPHQTVESEWIVMFYALASADPFGAGSVFTLQLVDKTSGNLLGTFGEVEMDRISGNLDVTVDKFDVEGADTENVTVGTRTFKNTYIMNGDGNPVLNFNYTVTSGYFDTALQIGMQWYNPATLKYEKIPGFLYSSHPFLAQGQGEELQITVDMTGLEKTGVYNVIASSVAGSRNTRLGSMTFAFPTSGIDDLESEADNAEVKYYNLQGVEISSPTKGELVIKREGAKVEKVIIK